MEKKLHRDEQHKMIAGVCAGLADYLNMDVTLIRVVFLVALIFHGAGLLPYIVLWIVLPKKLYGFNNPGNNYGPFNNAGPVDYTVPPQPFNTHYGTNVPPQQPGEPFVMPPKKASNASIIVGIALVAFGSFFLLDEFDFLPDWDLSRLWPIVFVIVGLVLVFSPKKQNPWDKQNWHAADEPQPEKTEEPTTPNNTTEEENNTPAV
jgi:phage shock protein C